VIWQAACLPGSNPGRQATKIDGPEIVAWQAKLPGHGTKHTLIYQMMQIYYIDPVNIM